MKDSSYEHGFPNNFGKNTRAYMISLFVPAVNRMQIFINMVLTTKNTRKKRFLKLVWYYFSRDFIKYTNPNMPIIIPTGSAIEGNSGTPGGGGYKPGV